MLQNKPTLHEESDYKEELLRTINYCTDQLLQMPAWHLCAPDILTKIGQTLAVDHVFLMENSNDPQNSIFCHWSIPKSSSLQPTTTQISFAGSASIHWQALAAIPESFHGPAHQLPNSLRKNCRRHNIGALSAVSIRPSQQEPWGLLLVADQDPGRRWNTSERLMLSCIATIFAGKIKDGRLSKNTRQPSINVELVNKALAKSNDRLNLVVSMATDAIMMLDKDGRLIFWNPGAEKLFGFKTGEILGLDLLPIFPTRRQFKEFLAVYRSFISTIKKDGGIATESNRKFSAVNQGGEPLFIEVSFSGKYSPDNEFIAVAICRDITSTHEAEMSLQKSRKQYKSLSDRFGAVLEAIPDALYEVNKSGVIVWANTGCAKLFGLPKELLIGKKCSDFLLSSDDDKSIALQTLESGKSHQKEVSYVNDSTWMLRSFAVKTDKNCVQEVVISGIDMTAQKRLSETVCRNSHLTALGTITAGVAHEINNPNNFIMLNSPLLAEIIKAWMPPLANYYQKNPEADCCGFSFPELEEIVPNLLHGIYEGSERIRRIVSLLREFSLQSRQQNFVEQNINALVENAFLLCRSQLKKYTCRTEINLGLSLPEILANGGQIEQVLINILLNAAESLRSEQGLIEVSTLLSQDEKNIIVTVKDEGEGMSKKHLSQIFYPFFSTKQDKGGTGLGLSVSHSIIQAHRGEIYFTSKEGLGTTATISLPVASACDLDSSPPAQA